MGYVSQAYAGQFSRGHTALGSHPQTGDVLLVSDVDRNSGMYVPGQAGMGKSSFLETSACQDIEKGNALVFVDPHGDSVKNIVSYVPQRVVPNIYVLDLEDEAWPFSVSPFAGVRFNTSAEKSKAIGRVTNIFKVLWPETASQANTPIYLQAAITALLSNPGSTIVDMLRLFSMQPEDIEWRRRMLQKVTAPDVLDHWDEYENGTKSSRSEASALIRRLKLLFMGRELVAGIVGQRTTSIDFRRAIEQRQIILIKLPINEYDEDARIVGTLLISELTHALFSFSDTDREQRPGVSIIIDECQNFTTPDVERLIQQGRKYGARLVLAHQARGQLPLFLREVAMGCRTTVAFRPNQKDVNELAPLFQDNHATIKPEDISNNAVHDLQVMGSDLPYQVRVFVESYLRGLKSSGEIPVKGLDPSIHDLLTKGYVAPKVMLPNPVSALNDLFHSVMRSGNARLPIPENAVHGLATGGELGFYLDTWGGLFAHNSDWLQRDVSQFPRHLVGSDGDSWYWKRRVEDVREQFLHCVFHLRMTMEFLAEHPIGKATTSDSNVAQLLGRLPPRHAFVKASDGVWYTKSLDTPQPVDAENLAARLHFIREQTRQTYCHPRSQVESKPTQPPDVAEQETMVMQPRPVVSDHSRWEDA